MDEPMRRINKKQIAVWMISAVPVLVVLFLYGRLPQQIPTSWGLDGQVDYSDKSTIWLMAGMAPFFGILFFALPYIDPKRRSYLKFYGAYQWFQIYMQVFLNIMVAIVVIESFRPGSVRVSTVVCLLCAVLFLLIGNMMPKFRQNFFCGFKTPWTLSDERVWTKTHRLAGRMMFAAGMVGLAGAFLPQERWKMAALLGPLALAVLVPGVMSYVWFRAWNAKPGS